MGNNDLCVWHSLFIIREKSKNLSLLEKKDLDLLVAGNVCNTWVYNHHNPEQTGQKVREMFEEQVGWAKEAGVDFVIAETLGFLGEALIALDVIKKHGLPAMVTFSVLGEKTHDGYDWIQACQLLEKNGADVVGRVPENEQKNSQNEHSLCREFMQISLCKFQLAKFSSFLQAK
jgi:methionine synthase I (cobalamin-dependent)